MGPWITDNLLNFHLSLALDFAGFWCQDVEFILHIKTTDFMKIENMAKFTRPSRLVFTDSI
jgi:hypothetical protein